MLTPLSPPSSPLPPSPPPPTKRPDNPLAEKDMNTQRVGRNNDKKMWRGSIPNPPKRMCGQIKKPQVEGCHREDSRQDELIMTPK